jgi:hypothetical protein
MVLMFFDSRVVEVEPLFAVISATLRFGYLPWRFARHCRHTAVWCNDSPADEDVSNGRNEEVQEVQEVQEDQ